MPPFEDDDLENFPFRDASNKPGRRAKWESREPNDDWDDPDERDLAPDEMTTLRCTRCRKWILEDTVRCPYCKEIQLEDHQNRKPLWFLIAAVLSVLAMLSYFIFDRNGLLSWLHL